MGLFAKEPYKRKNILQRRPIILLILLTVATPHPKNVSPHLFTCDAGPQEIQNVV